MVLRCFFYLSNVWKPTKISRQFQTLVNLGEPFTPEDSSTDGMGGGKVEEFPPFPWYSNQNPSLQTSIKVFKDQNQSADYFDNFISDFNSSAAQNMFRYKNINKKTKKPEFFLKHLSTLSASKFSRISKRVSTATGRTRDDIKTEMYPYFYNKHYGIPTFPGTGALYGTKMEPVALKAYQRAMKSFDRKMEVKRCPYVVWEKYPWLGAKPDAKVMDVTEKKYPYGIVEIKCPFTLRNVPPNEASRLSKNFPMDFDDNGNTPKIRKSHPCYTQIQGELAITGALWCDFTVYTAAGIAIHRVTFDPVFWYSKMSDLWVYYLHYVMIRNKTVKVNEHHPHGRRVNVLPISTF